MFSVVRLPLKGLWKGLVFEGFVQNVLRRAVRIGVPQTIIDSTLHIDIHSIYIYTYTHVYIYTDVHADTRTHIFVSLSLSFSVLVQCKVCSCLLVCDVVLCCPKV